MVLDSVDAIEAPEFETVSADENLRNVITKMLDKNYSQLGLTKRDEVIGAISFRSIFRALLVTEELFDSPKNLADRSAELAIEQPKRIHSDDSIEDLFDAIGERAYVVVETDDDALRIITEYNIREFFRKSTSPFLLIEEAELAIREIITTVYGDGLSEALEELSEQENEHLRSVSTIEDCSFRHYEIFISKRWDEGFNNFFHEQKDFIRELISKLGEDRNKLFHFRVEDRSELDLDLIRFAHEYFTSQQPLKS